jgi:hypothetical protein
VRDAGLPQREEAKRGRTAGRAEAVGGEVLEPLRVSNRVSQSRYECGDRKEDEKTGRTATMYSQVRAAPGANGATASSKLSCSGLAKHPAQRERGSEWTTHEILSPTPPPSPFASAHAD